MAKDEITKEFKYIGTRPNRPDGYDKVTGRAKYGADVSAVGMLHAAVLRRRNSNIFAVQMADKSACISFAPQLSKTPRKYPSLSMESIKYLPEET